MNKPTRRQWRGYAVLSALLLAALAALLLHNGNRHSSNDKSDNINSNSQLAQAIDNYGDSLISQAESEREQRRQHYRQQRQFDYDTSYRRQERHHYTPRERISVELNSADTTALQQLYGIGPSFARRIVNYRNRLGGFVRKEQLLEVYGMTDDRYEVIVPFILVDTTLVSRIDINNATLNQLRQHPYIDYYQARAIIDLRNSGFRFSSPNDLLMVNIIDEKTATKLSGYIQFN